MQALLAITRLTIKAAFRFRLVPVLAVLLLGAVILLPAVIKDDGTARGLTQIVLTYTLGLTTAMLGLVTLWLACGTLARDVEECQMQVVAVKPIARWQIWIGKWLGIVLLDAALLGLAAGIVYGQMLWRARHLPPVQQEILRNEIFVARSSVKETPTPIEPEVERVLQERLKDKQLAQMDRNELRKIVREMVKSRDQEVPPGMERSWVLDFSGIRELVRDQRLFVRTKFFVAQKPPSGTITGLWEAGARESGRGVWRGVLSQSPETFHEFAIPPGLLDDKGFLTVRFANQNDTSVVFLLEDGLEVLYRQGGFGLNYVRGVSIVLCWLALLAALGLAAASYLSFPVAAFCSLGILIVAFSTGTMSQVVEQGTVREVDHDTGQVGKATWFDDVTVVAFKGMLGAVNLVKDFSPIDLLSAGRTVTWQMVARAIGQIVLLIGGIFAGVGISAFTRRELATAQGKT